MNTNNLYERYQRQIILKEFGEAGQQKLLHAKVLVIGAGGLGCPALQYLAAAGVGTLGIADDDTVSLNNLHRQVLYSTNDIGFSKAIKATEILSRLNNEINIITHNERLTTANALTIIAGYDVIIDGTDNFATRYLINDACVLLGKPLVYGAVSQFEGQVAIFNCSNDNGTPPVNYRDLFPQPPKDDEVLNCAEAGVLGVLPGIIGTMQANETIKLLTGIGEPLINSILTYNALTNNVFQLQLHAKEGTRELIPATEHEFMQMDYAWLCAAQHQQPEISIEDFDALLGIPRVDIIDVREYDERPEITAFAHRRIPLAQIKNDTSSIDSDTIIVFCQSGKRSMQAAQMLFDTFGQSKKIFSLKDGILSWIKHQQTLQP